MNLFSIHAALLAGLLTTGGIAAAPAENPEAKLIAVLQSNAAPQEKAITC